MRITNIDLKLLFSTPLYIVQKQAKDDLINKIHHLKGKVLDIGCGKQPYRKYLCCKEYVGLENNPDLNPDVVGIATDLPFDAASFDGVLCTAVLEHLEIPEKCVSEISRVLKPGGVAYISSPMTWYLHYEPYDYYRFTKYGLKSLVERNGLSVESVSRIGGLFSYVFVRFTEILFQLLSKILFFLPSGLKNILLLTVLSPVSLIGYFSAVLLDRITKRDVFAWSLIVKKNQ